MSIKKFDIQVSLYDDREPVLSGVTQGDDFQITAHIVDKDGNAVDLSSIDIVEFFVSKADRTEYEDAILAIDSTGESLRVVDPAEGIIEFDVGGEATSAQGLCYCTINLVDADAQRGSTTGRFAFYVKASNSTNTFIRSSVYKALDLLVAEVQTYKDQLSRLEGLLGDYQSAMEDLTDEDRQGLVTVTAFINAMAGYVAGSRSVAGLTLDSDISAEDLRTAMGLTFPMSIAHGGTGAVTAAGARTALGLGLVNISDKIGTFSGTHKAGQVTHEAYYIPSLRMVWFNGLSTERISDISTDLNDKWWSIKDRAYMPARSAGLICHTSSASMRGSACVYTGGTYDGCICVRPHGSGMGHAVDVRVNGFWRCV